VQSGASTTLGVLTVNNLLNHAIKNIENETKIRTFHTALVQGIHKRMVQFQK
jgi:hypothetical protein